MADEQTEPRTVRFGAFEADLRTCELRKDGVKLKFSGQPFQVLAILLERPGEVVTREELQKRLWPDTFVDVERNLNTAVNKIREILGDSAETPRFVETLPRRGYRFIGSMEPPNQPAVREVTVEPVRRPQRRMPGWRIGVGVLAITVIALAALLAYRHPRQQRLQDQGALTAVPFTALPGLAASPAISPDGSRVAFAWSSVGDNSRSSFDLYVKGTGSETLLRLTQQPSAFLGPAWSPDGTRIAFYRQAGADSGIYVVPALGGPEQKLWSTSAIRRTSISWSPDGKWIAFVDAEQSGDHWHIYLLSMDSLESKRFRSDLPCFAEDDPAFSHNGQYLAFWCYRGPFDAALSLAPVQGGKLKMITPAWHLPRAVAWSPNDERLIVSVFKTGAFELNEVSIADGSVNLLGLQGTWPAVSLKTDKLVYNSSSFVSNIWRKDLVHADAPPVEFMPSSRAQSDAQFSPDGKRIVFASMRSGVQGVWLSNEDGSNLVQISNPDHPSGSPRWSPDGKKIAFDSKDGDDWEIYVADLTEGKPRKLQTNIPSGIRPSWSRDGQWIYFAGYERGIYRCPASGGDAVLLANSDGHALDPRESADGESVYFTVMETEGTTLRKARVLGGPRTESMVDGLPPVNSWTLTATGIYFEPRESDRSVAYLDFASKRIRTVFKGDDHFAGGLSISPDGRWMLYSQETGETGDIMLVDHFSN